MWLTALLFAVAPSALAGDNPYPSVREHYGSGVTGTAFSGDSLGPIYEGRGAGKLTPWLLMGGEGGGFQRYEPFVPIGYGGSFFELVAMPGARISPTFEAHVNMGFAVADGIHVFFLPKASLRIDVAINHWIGVAVGPTWRQAIPIYIQDSLPIPEEDLSGPSVELVVKVGKKWLVQARDPGTYDWTFPQE